MGFGVWWGLRGVWCSHGLLNPRTMTGFIALLEKLILLAASSKSGHGGSMFVLKHYTKQPGTLIL